jgi:hypothetical protein
MDRGLLLTIAFAALIDQSGVEGSAGSPCGLGRLIGADRPEAEVKIAVRGC